MARTALFGALTRALRETGAPFGPRALSRRHFLALAAAAAACRPVPRSSAQGLPGASAGIGIVGAGAAGLTVAYRLSRRNWGATLYEASDRNGGRMFTRKNFNEDGQFCEIGGELVDVNHTALRGLAREIGVSVDPLHTGNDPGEELYHIGQRLYSQHDMADPRNGGRGEFSDLAKRIAQDQAALLDPQEDWTERARALDNTNLKVYLDSLSNQAPDWVMQVLKIAYEGEFGLRVEDQSALNLIDFISTDTKEGFKVFGDSDEGARIRGGSSSLTDALTARLIGHVENKMQHALVAIRRSSAGVVLVFDSPNGRIEVEHPQVVLALPFTKLRRVEGIDQIGLSEGKLRAIRELGYGDNSKLMVSTTARPWNERERDFPAKVAGVFYSDRFQQVWDTSRGQNGARGILTNFLANQQSRDEAMRTLGQGLERLSPAIAQSMDASKIAWMAWARNPFVLGSFASAKVGQYTTLLEEAAPASEDGRIHFAGEHTSSDFLGFMNGAVESGERVAAELLGT
jgi:monoamine oxidase